MEEQKLDIPKMEKQEWGTPEFEQLAIEKQTEGVWNSGADNFLYS